MASPYTVLGISSDASPEDVVSAWRKTAKQTHPDTGGSDSAFRDAQDAYRLLSDPARRGEYDRQAQLRQHFQGTAPRASYGSRNQQSPAGYQTYGGGSNAQYSAPYVYNYHSGRWETQYGTDPYQYSHTPGNSHPAQKSGSRRFLSWIGYVFIAITILLTAFILGNFRIKDMLFLLVVSFVTIGVARLMKRRR